MSLNSKGVLLVVVSFLVVTNALSAYFVLSFQKRAKQIERSVELEKRLVYVTNEIKRLRVIEVTNEMVISNARPIAESDLDGAIKLFYSLNSNK